MAAPPPLHCRSAAALGGPQPRGGRLRGGGAGAAGLPAVGADGAGPGVAGPALGRGAAGFGGSCISPQLTVPAGESKLFFFPEPGCQLRNFRVLVIQ